MLDTVFEELSTRETHGIMTVKKRKRAGVLHNIEVSLSSEQTHRYDPLAYLDIVVGVCQREGILDIRYFAKDGDKDARIIVYDSRDPNLGSKLETKFWNYWKTFSGSYFGNKQVLPLAQASLVKGGSTGKKWTPVDFYFADPITPKQGVVVEIDGIGGYGAHTRFMGKANDERKRNLLTERGYTVLTYTTLDLKSLESVGAMLDQVSRVLRKETA